MEPVAFPPPWQTLSKDAWKTDLGGDLPEVLVLELSNEDYKEFRTSEAAAMKYLDDHKYLKRKLIKVVFDQVPPPDRNDTKWILVATHTTKSTGFIVAYPNP